MRKKNGASINIQLLNGGRQLLNGDSVSTRSPEICRTIQLILKIHLKKYLVLFTFSFLASATLAQTQKGTDIDGTTTEDNVGYSVSMPDANTIAIGCAGTTNFQAPPTSTNRNGLTRIYRFDGSSWVQKGADIIGENLYDQSGYSVSMPDSNTVAIGAPRNNGNRNGNESGHVRVFRWNGSAWLQKGTDIDGQFGNDKSGTSVSMPDSNTVAIGEMGFSISIGRVRVYRWTGWTWTQKGSEVVGDNQNDLFGKALSMPDANTLAVGATDNDGNGSDAGQLKVFRFALSDWEQKGLDILGDSAGAELGWSVSMPDSNTVAVGLPSFTIAGERAGAAKVYTWNGSGWVQKGGNILGTNTNDYVGWSISMPNADMIAVAGMGVDQTNGGNGSVRVFSWNGTAWAQVGSDISANANNNSWGTAVSMPDETTIGIGDPGTRIPTDLIAAGQVRVYDITLPTSQTKGSSFAISAYPNPTTGEIAIDLGVNATDVQVTVRNIMGQEVLNQTMHNTNLFHLNLPGDAGIYLIEVQADGQKAKMKALKQ